MQKDEKNSNANEFLTNVLKTEPEFTVSDNFVDRITELISRKMIWKQYVKEFLIYLAVIVGFAVSVAAMAFIWYGANWNDWLNFLLNNTMFIIGITFLVVFILFVDKTLLPFLLNKPRKQIDAERH
jgi:hypothetical protein